MNETLASLLLLIGALGMVALLILSASVPGPWAVVGVTWFLSTFSVSALID